MLNSRRMSILFGLALAATLAASPRAQTSTPPLPDIQKLGPQVDSKVPDFTLPDQHGTPRTLQSLIGPKGLMLLFYRSADWCPYCKTQLAELQSRLPVLSKQGIGVAAISPASARTRTCRGRSCHRRS